MSTFTVDVPDHEKHAVARKTTGVSIALNVVLATLQMAIGSIAHSQALIADGVHSLSDLVSDFIVLIANRHSGAQPDADHNYGHSRYETVASLLLGAILIMVGIGMLWARRRPAGRPRCDPGGARDRAAGGGAGGDLEGGAVPLHAARGAPRALGPAGGERLACALRRGFLAGGGDRHRRQPGGDQAAGSDRGRDRRLHGRAHGLEFRLERPAGPVRSRARRARGRRDPRAAGRHARRARGARAAHPQDGRCRGGRRAHPGRSDDLGLGRALHRAERRAPACSRTRAWWMR